MAEENVQKLLDMLYEMIDEAKNAPLSNDKCVLNRDEALDLLDEIRAQMPVELKRAQELVRARDEYVEAAKRDVERMMQKAEFEAKSKVSESEVLTAARAKGHDIVTRAEERSREMYRVANDYSEDVLRRTEEAIQAAAQHGAAAPAIPVKDTIKQAKGGNGKTVPEGCMVENTPDRSTLYAVQTPQCFDRAAYLAALDELDEASARLVTDDCSLFELTGRPVELVQGDYANIKITTREDLPRAENGGKKMRIGHGYDVHRLVEGRKLILGGVEVPYEKGLLGHSDADVLAHAVMDAVLGAAALGDIGQHFPDNDPEYAGADSLKLACRVAQILKEHGWRIENIDATLLCQRPKLAPHIPAMRANLAAAFGLPVEAVSVKATTEEHLGFTGEGLGIAAHAVALIEAV